MAFDHIKAQLKRIKSDLRIVQATLGVNLVLSAGVLWRMFEC